MKTNWNNEIRRRLRGCPRAAKKLLKPQRDELNRLYRPGHPCQEIEAAREACRMFDARLRSWGWELNPAGPLNP